MLIHKHNIYGRKKGRQLSYSNRILIKNLLPKIEINKSRITSDFNNIRKNLLYKNIFLEIGFGNGEHLVELASQRKDWFFIGVEPYINGVAQLLKEIKTKGISNISVFIDDGLLLLENLPENSINQMAIMFPDPWPKSKHRNRRIINKQILLQISRVLKPSSEIRLASDHKIYQKWILQKFYESKLFEWIVKSKDDWEKKPRDWPSTRYMKKAIKLNNKPAWFLFMNNKTM